MIGLAVASGVLGVRIVRNSDKSKTVVVPAAFLVLILVAAALAFLVGIVLDVGGRSCESLFSVDDSCSEMMFFFVYAFWPPAIAAAAAWLAVASVFDGRRAKKRNGADAGR